LNEFFNFKKFTIDQNRSAMKVGTDGVLLGAWAFLGRNTETILDIGAGTGLIALMLAQRSAAENIDAIEIDADAYEQCVENFEASDWGDRLFCYHTALNDFVTEWEDTYDLIVSNPPFFKAPKPRRPLTPPRGQDSIDSSRKMARFYDSLPFEELLEGVSKLLSGNGVFATIIPFKEEERFLEIASRFKLYPQRKTRVRGNPNSEVKRSLLEFGFETFSVKTDELTIELERHIYTSEYSALTQDFYLKM